MINSRTGTVVINQQVKISAAACHTARSTLASRPLTKSSTRAFTEGRGVETRDVANSTVEVSEGPGGTGLIEETVDLRDIVDAINQSGASTTSLIAILEALKSAGSLKAELVVI